MAGIMMMIVIGNGMGVVIDGLMLPECELGIFST